MDTSTLYSNILNTVKQSDSSAVKGDRATEIDLPTPNTPEGLSLEKRANNYRVFDALMKQGVDLEKIVEQSKQTEELQRQVDSMKKQEVDAELFAMMESVVKNEPEVKMARQRASEIKSRILTEFCLRSPEYAEALHQYRRAVNQAYIVSKGVPHQDKEVPDSKS